LNRAEIVSVMPKSKKTAMKTATKTPQQLANDETWKIFWMTSIFIEEPEPVELIRYSVFDGLTEEGIYDYVSNFVNSIIEISFKNPFSFSGDACSDEILVNDLNENNVSVNTLFSHGFFCAHKSPLYLQENAIIHGA